MLVKLSKIAILIIVWTVALALIGYVIWRDRDARPEYVVPVFESDDEPFPIDDTGDDDRSDLIRVDFPKPGDVIASPLTVKGSARGQWYFEATFPIRLEDGNGKVLAQHYAEAEGEWMTTEFVPFTSTFAFDTPTSPTGTLILMKSNASGLPEHDDEIRVLVRFDTSAPVASGGCQPTGCSSQVCADEEVVTTCEYRPEYECYKDPSARCERQSNGECGWTPTVDLIACLTSTAEIR